MALDPSIVGRSQEPFTVELERGRLQFFSRVIGETDPVYLDPEAARAAGHPDVLAPPTVLFGLELERADTLGFLEGEGVDLTRVLHGEQRFTYLADAHAGDRLRFESTFVDTYSKRGGALEFLVRRTQVSREDGTPVAELEGVTVIRNEVA
jgi:acyl dehydratase